MRTYKALPDIVEGFEIYKNSFSFVQPEETANLIENPSGEFSTIGYAALNGNVSQSAAYQYRGVYSLKLTAADPASAVSKIYYAIALEADKEYTFSVDVFSPRRGYQCRIYFTDTSGNLISGAVSFKTKGFWERPSVTYVESTNATRWLVVEVTGERRQLAPTGVFRMLLALMHNATQTAYYVEDFYTDGWQLEQKSYATMYCDGDQQGFVPGQQAFGWNGAPHASTSWRSKQTLAGGREVGLYELGLAISKVVVLGVTPLENFATPSVLGGAVYNNTIPSVREFALSTMLTGETIRSLNKLRLRLANLIRHDSTVYRQPILLRYRPANENGEIIGEPFNIPCTYRAGLEGDWGNENQENMVLSFQQYTPLISGEGDSGLALTSLYNILSANYIFSVSADGVYSNMASGLGNYSQVIARSNDNFIYAAGTNVNKWDGRAWSALGSIGTVKDIAFGPDGTIYVCGNLATTYFVRKWDGSSWVDLGAAPNNIVNAIIVDNAGNLYAGGQFTTIGGGTVHFAAKWNGTTWADVGGASMGTVSALVLGPDGLVYTAANYGGAQGVFKYTGTGSTWVSVGTTSGVLFSVAFAQDGAMYVGGHFTSIGGIAATNVAKWNGVIFSAMGTGANSAVTRIRVGPDGKVYICGYGITAVGGINLPDNAAVWSNGAWMPLGFDIVSGSTVRILDIYPTQEAIYVCYGLSVGAVDLYYEAVNTITVDNPTRLKMVIDGPGSLWRIKNHTTGKTIFFNNLTILDGERIILDLSEQGKPRFTSNNPTRLDLMKYINVASGLDFTMSPGANEVSIFMTGTDPGSKCLVSWKNSVWGLHGN